jgi:hypothetical protein
MSPVVTPTQSIVRTDTVERSPALRDAIDSADRWLLAVLEDSSSPVAAEWDVADDAQGRELLTLRLRDQNSSVAGIFTPSELTDRIHAERRFYRLFGDLLEVRIARLLQAISVEPVGA